MGILHATEPHFIRCIVPNTHKQPLMVETVLIMQQLTCNGVLEGIRVCMLGFPNRMLYPDFKMRYAILGAKEIASSSDNKVAVRALMDKVGFPVAKYQLGHTKVFFRAGALAGLEEERDNIVLKLVRWMQGQCYGVIRRKDYNNKNDQRELMKIIQRNCRKYQGLRDWGWFIIMQKTRPLIGQVDEDHPKELQEVPRLEGLGMVHHHAKDLRFPPTFMPLKPISQPLITSPFPNANSKPFPAMHLSNTFLSSVCPT